MTRWSKKGSWKISHVMGKHVQHSKVASHWIITKRLDAGGECKNRNCDIFGVNVLKWATSLIAKFNSKISSKTFLKHGSIVCIIYFSRMFLPRCKSRSLKLLWSVSNLSILSIMVRIIINSVSSSWTKFFNL